MPKTQNTLWAHSAGDGGEPPEGWQSLEAHLAGVARLAREFASAFGAGQWGEQAGWLHDAGKGSAEFQNKLLKGLFTKPDHSSYGARLAHEWFGPLGTILAYAIAGHHGGLPDGGGGDGQLLYRLKDKPIPKADPPCARQAEPLPPLPIQPGCNLGFTMALFTRMLFSCLVDADYLDTERHMDRERADARQSIPSPSLSTLKQRLDDHMHGLCAKAAKNPSQVNTLRRQVLEQCRTKALLEPGFFTLTVPTGGAKTLSSMTFALDHAMKWEKRRIIYAIPFTSIIEQNARVFREALGQDAVLEHHSNYKESEESERAEYEMQRALSAENWDAPVVVTTNVQFFESLFASKTSRCRKLHNIAGSVIVLDEAQAIPTEYLKPCLCALKELVQNYGCTVVLCTATQPALDVPSLEDILPVPTEIVDDPEHLFQQLKRVSVDFVGKLEDEELVSRLSGHEQVLCIVHTKAHARDTYLALAQAMGTDAGLFHLSTNMHPVHRSRVLQDIRECLKLKRPCRVISTSLVEAGVDLDFPVAYRAISGLDSIAQAAGRCNREGKMPEHGQVFVFESDRMPRLPWFRRCAGKTAEALRNLPQGTDPLGLEAIAKYFELLYDVEQLDSKGIIKALSSVGQKLIIPFREIASLFKLIEEASTGVIIPGEPEADRLVADLRHTTYPRKVLRKLQQYTVSVREREFNRLYAAGALEMVNNEFPLLSNKRLYRPEVGLVVEDEEVMNPADLSF